MEDAGWSLWVRLDAGTGAEWLSAIGGLLTAGVALYLLWQGQQDRRRERAERRSAQARRIRVSYPEVVSEHYDNESFNNETLQYERGPLIKRFEAGLWNASDDVITEVVVTLHELDGKGRPSPSSETRYKVRVLPNERWTFYGQGQQLVPLVEFTDGNGIRWNINARHQISEGAAQKPTGREDDQIVSAYSR